MSILTLAEVVRAPTIFGCGRMLAWGTCGSMVSLAVAPVSTDVPSQPTLPVVHTGLLRQLLILELDAASLLN